MHASSGPHRIGYVTNGLHHSLINRIARYFLDNMWSMAADRKCWNIIAVTVPRTGTVRIVQITNATSLLPAQCILFLIDIRLCPEIVAFYSGTQLLGAAQNVVRHKSVRALYQGVVDPCIPLAIGHDRNAAG